MHSGPNNTSWEAGVDDVSLEELLEQEFLWGRAANTGNVREGACSSARRLIQAVARAVPVTTKGCEGLIRYLAIDV